MNIAKPEQYNFDFEEAELNALRDVICLLSNLITEMKNLDCGVVSPDECDYVELESLETIKEELLKLKDCNMMY